MPEGTTVTRELYVEVPERTMTQILRVKQHCLVNGSKVVNNHPPHLPNLVPAEFFSVSSSEAINLIWS